METAIQVNEMAENEYAGEVPPSNPDRLINWIIKRQGEISSFSIFEQVDARLPSLTSMSDLLDGYISHLESIKSESVIVEIPIPDESYHTTPEDYRSAYVASGFTKPDNFVFNNNDREKAQARLLKVNYQSTKLYNGSTYNNDGRRHSSNNVIASFEKGSDEEIAILFESKYKEEYKERILEINSKINKLSNGSWIQRLANQGRIRSEKLNLEVESRKLERGEKLSNEFNRKYHGYNIIDIST
ncbi:MAG: hypothetical protein WCO33_05025, partial [bacterium]